MSKTAIPRDQPPKVTIERMRIQTKDQRKQENNQNSRLPVTLNNKDDFIMTKTYDQFREIPLS
jgi:hypothetical protein